jgi:hypothetical protein
MLPGGKSASRDRALLMGGGLLAGHPDQLLAPHHLAAGVDGWVRPRRRTRPVLIN